MSYTYLYKYFETIENISPKKIENISGDFFDYINKISKKDYILNKNQYILEINEYIKKNNIASIEDDLKKIKTLEIISNDYFNELKKKNIEDFSRKLIDKKLELNKTIYYINNYFKLEKNLKYNIINNFKKNVSYDNPINFKNKIYIYNEDFFKNSIDETLYDNHNNIYISIDILLNGNIINTSLPSIGLIESSLSKSSSSHIPIPKTITNFIKIILNKIFDVDNEIPLKSLDIENIISDILLNFKNNNTFNKLNINIYNKEKFNNEKMSLLIKNMINSVKIDFKSIFTKKSNNKKKDIIKNEYIIPYSLKGIGSDKEIIYLSKSSDFNKYIDIKSLITYNNEIVKFVIKEINVDDKKINNKYYKDILACFLFYIIRIFHEILNQYINKIDDLLKQLINVKEKRFGILNIKDAFEYTTLLKYSLNKFKLVLLNNFYNLFLPSKYFKNNYGMEKDLNNCYICEYGSIFLNSNDNIINNYPINLDSSDEYNVDKLFNFILNIKDKSDIYNNKDILEFGGYSFNKDIMKISTSRINNYYNLLYKNNNFTLFIINILINNFKENIPYELIDDLESKKDLMKKISLKSDEKDILKKFMLFKFNDNIEKSTNYYIKLLEIRNKIKISKKQNITNLYNIEEIYYLCFKIYYIKAMCIISITQKNIYDVNTKNSLLTEYFKIKKSYENIISKHISRS
jgi:hypothetical protein